MNEYNLDLVAYAFSMWFKGQPMDMHVIMSLFECTLVPAADEDMFVLTRKNTQESLSVYIKYRAVVLAVNGKNSRSIHNLTGNVVVL